MSKWQINAAAWLTAIGVAAVLAVAVSSGGSVSNQEPANDAGKFVLGVIYSGLTLFADQRIDQTERDRLFTRLVAENLDTPRIARFVLGRYWNPASERERQQFVDVYPAYLARPFETRISQFVGAMVRVSSVKSIDNETRVNTTIEFLGPRPAAATTSKMEIGWLVRATPDGWKIEDIDYHGVSLKLQQRTDLVSIIATAGETVAGLVGFIIKSLGAGLPVKTGIPGGTSPVR